MLSTQDCEICDHRHWRSCLPRHPCPLLLLLPTLLFPSQETDKVPFLLILDLHKIDTGIGVQFTSQHNLCKEVQVTLNNSLEVISCNSLEVISLSSLEATKLSLEASTLLQNSSRWSPLATLLTIPHLILDPQKEVSQHTIKILSPPSKLLIILMQCDLRSW